MYKSEFIQKQTNNNNNVYIYENKTKQKHIIPY